jgi:hypothetical protein
MLGLSGYGHVPTLIIFLINSRKILKTLELLDPGRRIGAQNIEPLGLILKIFFSKNLADDANAAP